MRERMIETVDLGTDERLILLSDACMRLYVGDERVWSVSALGDGIVALGTVLRTVHIGAADYWRLLHGDVPPTERAAGYLAAQMAQVRGHVVELIDQLAREGLIDCASYPGVCEAVASLETALGVSPELSAVVS
jgi:hypothetical protein